MKQTSTPDATSVRIKLWAPFMTGSPWVGSARYTASHARRNARLAQLAPAASVARVDALHLEQRLDEVAGVDLGTRDVVPNVQRQLVDAVGRGAEAGARALRLDA